MNRYILVFSFLLTSVQVSAQISGLQFKIEFRSPSDTVYSQNLVIHSKDAGYTNGTPYKISFFNSSDADIYVQPKFGIGSDYSEYRNYVYLPYTPIFVRIYKIMNGKIERVDYENSSSFHHVMDDPIKKKVFRKLKKNEEYTGYGNTTYFEELPKGEYDVYFDYLSNSDTSADLILIKDDLINRKCHCGVNNSSFYGYYLQPSLNKTHLKIIE